jgi:hypothetical protein
MLRVTMFLFAALGSTAVAAQSQPNPGTNSMDYCPVVPGGNPYEAVSLVCYRKSNPYRCHCQQASFDQPIVTPGSSGMNDRPVSRSVLLTNNNSGFFASEQGIDFSNTRTTADRSEIGNSHFSARKEASEN